MKTILCIHNYMSGKSIVYYFYYSLKYEPYHPRLVTKVKNVALALFFFIANLKFPAERAGYKVVIT